MSFFFYILNIYVDKRPWGSVIFQILPSSNTYVHICGRAEIKELIFYANNWASRNNVKTHKYRSESKKMYKNTYI